jgi:hypothetical protein
MLKSEIEKYKIRTYKDHEELNYQLREFMRRVPKNVRLALTIEFKGPVYEKIITTMRNIALGKQHWMYSEFDEYDGYMLPTWYYNTKLKLIELDEQFRVRTD